MTMKEGADHWAFLEDFEAPMWVDLALEVKLSDKELDDEWFHRSHKFHQLPSRKLKEAFKHVDSGGKLEIDIEGSSFLKIPSSISKSRGKSYVNNKKAIDFQMSLSDKECLTENADGETLQSQLGNDMLHKSAHGDSNLSLCIYQKNENGSVVFELPNTSTVPITNNSSSWNHMEPNMYPNDPKSSITSESNQVPGPEGVVASNPIIGRRSQLLTVMKQSLRKSCTGRMATRGQITDLKQTNGLRYSCGKSSVASCSVHSQDAQDINVAGTQRASKTPESKNAERLSQESKTRDKVKKSTDVAGQCATKTSGCGSNEEPLQSNAKPGSSYPRRTKNIDSTTVPTSLKIKPISRASECGNKGKTGLLKVLKSTTSAKPTQYVNNNGSIFKVNKAATVNIVPNHSTVRQKLGVGVPMGTKAKISNKASVGVDVDVGKSVVAKSKQPQVTKSKAIPVHRRPLAPVNLANQESNRIALAPVNLTNQGSSTFARKATNKGKTTDIVSKPLHQGKENIVSKLLPSKKHGNGRGVGVGGVADESNRMKLTESRKNKELRREPVTTSKLKQRAN